MKQNLGTVLLLLHLILAVMAHSSARLLKPKQSGKDAVLEESGIITNHAASSLDRTTGDFSNLMGEDIEEEECAEKDAECMKRRMTAEAHLDYIYTQHHKPKP